MRKLIAWIKGLFVLMVALAVGFVLWVGVTVVSMFITAGTFALTAAMTIVITIAALKEPSGKEPKD